MPARRATDPQDQPPRRRPAMTPEGREDQLIALASDLAEKQLRAGTASALVVNHFLRLGSSREKLEKRKLELESELLEVKREAIESAQRVEVLYEEAIAAMRRYSGQEPLHSEREFDD